MKTTDVDFMPSPMWLYVAWWFFFLYVFVSLLSFSPGQPNNFIVSGMYMINFCVHEVSHILFIFLPPILTALAGSFGEVSFTILLLVAAIRAKSYFVAVFAGLWVMLGFISAGVYMADAKAQALPLIGPGDTVIHDWNFIFTKLGWLDASVFIGSTVRGVGVAIGAMSLFFGVYLIYAKYSQRSLKS